MLKADYSMAPTDLDEVIAAKLIPTDHYLRRLKAAIDFAPLRALVADCYAQGVGAPAEEPVGLLKRSLRQFQYDLSDRQVLRQAQVNGAVRFFLDLSVESALPVPSLLSQFRTRLGEARLTRGFNEILRQARAQGVGKERRRLKEAPPLIAHSAIPSTLRLVAQRREQLWTAAASCAAPAGAAQRAQGAVVRAARAALPEAPRRLARVPPRRASVAWGEPWQQRVREAADPAPPLGSQEPEVACGAALDVAHQVLNDREPAAQDKLRSLGDPEVRTGNHGDS